MDYVAIGKRIRAYRKKIDLACALGVRTDDLIFEKKPPALRLQSWGLLVSGFRAVTGGRTVFLFRRPFRKRQRASSESDGLR